MKVVCNSSPIIVLQKLGYLSFMVGLFSGFTVPEAVQKELSQKSDAVINEFNRLIQEGKIQVESIKLRKLLTGLSHRLGKGEAETILLAAEREADIVILDDYVARQEARKLGLRVVGTLGIIRKLIVDGTIEIESKDELYQRLRVFNFRIKKELFDDILKGL